MPSDAFTSTRPFAIWPFLIVFCGAYVVFQWIYDRTPYEFLRDVVHAWLIVKPVVWVLSTFTPEDGAIALAGAVRSQSANLQIVRGCDGAGLLFLLWAAVLASRASLRAVTVGLLGAFVLTGCLNLLRVISLYFVVSRWPGAFHSLHEYALPLLLLLACFVAFATWLAWIGPYAPSSGRTCAPACAREAGR